MSVLQSCHGRISEFPGRGEGVLPSGSGDSTVVRALEMWPMFDSRTWRHMWVEFVVGSHLCSERFFSGYSGFSLSSKTNTCKFQCDLESVPS